MCALQGDWAVAGTAGGQPCSRGEAQAVLMTRNNATRSLEEMQGPGAARSSETEW